MSHACAQPDFAAALMASELTFPPGLRTWNGSDPARRFSVYRNNVRSSLAAALADSFPVLSQLLGEEYFRAMALEYVQASPPRSPVLLEYGADLGDFIAGFAPLADLPYLADVARLEHLRLQSFHAADVPVLQASDLQPLLAQPEQLQELRMVTHASLRLLRSPFAVLSLWQAHQHRDESTRDDALARLDLGQGEDVVIWRPLLEVHTRQLPPGAFEVLACLQRGHALGDSLQAGSHMPGFDLQAIFNLLVHDGLLAFNIC